MKILLPVDGSIESVVNHALSLLLDNQSESFKGSTEIHIGHAKYVILREAEDWGADLIVLGVDGVTGMQRRWLGSITHAVLMHAKCPVELIRRRKADAA
jgi:nucleotide-binding universal stress UspA family protein